MTPAQASGVVAVVPLFNPDAAAADGIRGLAVQVEHVVLVDDGSPVDVGPFVDGLDLENVRLVRSLANRGIADALNRGVEAASRLRGCEYVLTADQDSVFAADYVEQALEAIDLLRRAGFRFASVAAGVVDGKPNRGDPIQALPLLTTPETIQSGILFPITSLQDLGLFDESFFIDCVDTDYILRGAGRGMPTVLAPLCRMEHAVGEGIPVRLPRIFRRRDRVVPYHGPVRRYYIVRNRVRLLRRHGFRHTGWALVQSREQIKSAMADLVYGVDSRPTLLRAMTHGLVDGLLGRGGRVPQRLEARLRRSPGPTAPGIRAGTSAV